jgi:acetyl coenzyme A synthetase (ADP forming)-like protein
VREHVSHRDSFVVSPAGPVTASRPSIARLLEPRSVAVIGASRDAANLGRRVLEGIVESGFRGNVYPVNAHADDLAGRPCYRHVRDLPPDVDLAIIAVPRDAVLPVVDECIVVGVGSLLVITAGFAETGPEGRALQQQLRARVRSAGLRMVGPNCMGLINTTLKLNASFSPVMPPTGPVALSSQSGALGMTILELARDRQLGFSTFVSVGNKADVSSNDLLEYWETDPQTSVILLYLESFGNPRKFGDLARRIGRTKPIVALKAGRTRAGNRAASSHTAALAASDVVVDALFDATGVIRADTIDEMFDVAACLALQPVPAGRRIAIVTNAGGPGILAVDACERSRLSVIEFSEDTRRALRAFLPASASVNNPVDMVASASGDDYRRTIEAVAASDADTILVLYTPVDPTHAPSVMDGLRSGIASARNAGCRKPILACLMTDASRPVPLRVGQERVPVFVFPENAVRAIRQVARYGAWRSAGPGTIPRFDDARPSEARRLVQAAIAARGDTWLTTDERERLLAAYGLPVLQGRLARTVDDAVAAAADIGGAVALKLSAPALLHKSDIGGVRTGLRTADEVRGAAGDLFTIATSRGFEREGVLVQPMITDALETMIGIAHDPLFGSVVGFGLGGTEVELEGDVHFRVVPVSDRDADEVIRETRAYARLLPHRGRPAGDLDALTELLLRVSQLANDLPEVVELDFNPVMVRPAGNGCVIVDARVRVAPVTAPVKA